MPDDAYRAGRADVLSRFAARPVIFPDAAFALSCDRKARDNLARELASEGMMARVTGGVGTAPETRRSRL